MGNIGREYYSGSNLVVCFFSRRGADACESIEMRCVFVNFASFATPIQSTIAVVMLRAGAKRELEGVVGCRGREIGRPGGIREFSLLSRLSLKKLDVVVQNQIVFYQFSQF
jgi:hypothetical protein